MKIELKRKIFDKIYLVINDLSKENKLLKEEMKNKDNDIQNLKGGMKNLINENIQIKNRLNAIEEFILNFKKEKEEKEKKEKKEKKECFDFNKSYIFKNLEEKIRVKEWISENGIIKNIKLIYRATKDGDTLNNFYDKCSQKGPTLSIIKTKKGRRFR